jgi:hypothetical protein
MQISILVFNVAYFRRVVVLADRQGHLIPHQMVTNCHLHAFVEGIVPREERDASGDPVPRESSGSHLVF